MLDLRLPAFRKIEAGDLPWIMTLAHERYGTYDPGGFLGFLIQASNNPDALLLCSAQKSAFLVASAFAPPWWPERRECHVMILCAKPGAHWQAARLLRESVAWARLHKCVQWRFHSENGQDVGALCRWVGAHEDTARYMLDL